MTSIVQPEYKIFGPEGFIPWDAYEALKGFLILLIVMGHNSTLATVMPDLDWYLYNFHVSSFLMLPFLFSRDSFSFATARDKFVRYMVPFAVFVFFTAPINWVYQPDVFVASTELQYLGEALLFGTAPTLKLATGFSLFWFLPTIALLTIFRSWYYSLPSGFAAYVLIAMIVTDIILNWTPPHGISHYPFGFPIVTYIFPLGIIGAHLANLCLRSSRQTQILFALLVALALLETLSENWGTRLNLAAGRFQYAILPQKFILHKVLVIVGFLTCLMASPYLAQFNILKVVGKHSLLIYLTHSIIYYSLIETVDQFVDTTASLSWGILTFILTIIISVSISTQLDNLPRLKNLITPRDWTTFKSAFRAS